MPSPEQNFAAKALSNVFSGASPPPQRCATISGSEAVSKGTTHSMRPRRPPEGCYQVGKSGGWCPMPNNDQQSGQQSGQRITKLGTSTF